MRHDCERHGLEDVELACLTGYSGRAVDALCHLREAWCVADGTRQPFIETAAGAVLASLDSLDLGKIGETVMKEGLGPETGARFVRAARRLHQTVARVGGRR